MIALRIDHHLKTAGGLCAAAFDRAGQQLALGEWGGGQVRGVATNQVAWEGPLQAADADEEDAGVASVLCVDEAGRWAAFAMTAHTGATGLDGLFVVDVARRQVHERTCDEAPLALRAGRAGAVVLVTPTRVGTLAASATRVRWLRERWAGRRAVDRVLDASDTGAVTFTVRRGAHREIWRSVPSGRRRLGDVRGDVRGLSRDGRAAFVRDDEGLRIVTLATGRSALRRWPAELATRPLEVHAVSGDGARVVVSVAGAASDDAWVLTR